MSRIALYLDEHVQLSLAAALRTRGVDVLTTQEAGSIAFSDIDQLNFAIHIIVFCFLLISDILLKFIMNGQRLISHTQE